MPFKRFKVVEQFNQLLCLVWLKLRYGLNKKTLLWLFDPIFYAFPYVRKLIPEMISIYDCVDYHWNRNKAITSIIRKTEIKLIRNSDYFFVNSNALKNKHNHIRESDAVVPLGFAIDEFSSKQKKGSNLRIYNPQRKPVVGYVGCLNYRLDYALLFKLIRNNPLWLFVFIGPIQLEGTDLEVKLKINRLLKFKNVDYLPNTDRLNLGNLISQFKIAVIPYDVKYPINKFCFPMKLMEYFYLQKPVISTPIEELKRLNKLVKTGKTDNEWQKHIRNILSLPLSPGQKINIRNFAVKNSWKNKIKVISKYIYGLKEKKSTFKQFVNNN